MGAAADGAGPAGDALAALRQRIAGFAAERDWGQFHSPKNLSMALIVEAAELVEQFQWLTEGESHALAPDKRQAVGEEMADIFIYLVRLADVLGEDLLAAAWAKIEKNEGRYPVARVRGDARRAAEYESAAGAAVADATAGEAGPGGHMDPVLDMDPEADEAADGG